MNSFHGLLYWLGIPIFLILLLCVFTRKLTPLAAVIALLLGIAVLNASITGALMLIAFFAMGVLASAYKKAVKRQLKGGQQYSETRNWMQVLCNGGVAGVLSLFTFEYPDCTSLFVLMMAGSLAAASADTVASELGTVMGKRFVNVLNFRKEEPGPDGVISLEGTLAGLCAASVIALIYRIAEQNAANIIYIILAGIFSNWLDSVMGASLQRRGWLNNDAVNALNTMAGALSALALKLFFG